MGTAQWQIKDFTFKGQHWVNIFIPGINSHFGHIRFDIETR
jgi:hypothetical protein